MLIIMLVLIGETARESGSFFLFVRMENLT